MNGDIWLLPAVAVPLLVAPLFAVPATRSFAWALAPWTALPALAVALFAEPPASLQLPGLLAGVELGLDHVVHTFLLFTAVVGALAGWCLRAELGRDPHRFRFAGFYLAGLAGNLGVILAQEIVTFYTFFALMTLAAYGFVIHRQTAEARYAGRVYIVLVVLGEGMLLAGLLLVAAAGGSVLAEAPQAVAGSPHRDWIIALLLGGFGVKAGLLPLHVSLPLAYAAAPISGAVLLAGAMINAGLLGWLRLLPLGAAALPEWGAWLVSAGLMAMFYGVAVGLAQLNLKAMLAYSSISQMGFMIVALGLALLAPSLWPLALSAVSIYAAHHALVKGGLFLGLGAAESGVPRRWALAGTALLAVMLAGAPLTSGAVAKFHLKSLAQLAPPPWGTIVELLLPVGAFATALLMGRFLFLLWHQSASASGHTRSFAVTWLVALAAGSALIWVVPQVDSAALVEHWREPAAWWEESWPALAAALVTVALARTVRGRRRRRPWIPPGDIVVPLQRSWRALERRARFAWLRRARVLEVSRPPWAAVRAWSAKLQALLQNWSVAGTLLVLLMLVVLLLLAL